MTWEIVGDDNETLLNKCSGGLKLSIKTIFWVVVAYKLRYSLNSEIYPGQFILINLTPNICHFEKLDMLWAMYCLACL